MLVTTESSFSQGSSVGHAATVAQLWEPSSCPVIQPAETRAVPEWAAGGRQYLAFHWESHMTLEKNLPV